MHCKNYLPVEYSVRNLSDDSSSHCPQNYENRSLSGHVYDGCMLSTVNRYPVYDKEKLKRTMVEHEAIFRKQVWELHRLYGIQKDYMDELKKEGEFEVPVEVETSECFTYSSQMPSEATRNIWEIPNLTAIDTSYNRVAVACTDDMKPSLNLLKENTVQCSEISTKKKNSLENCELLDSRLNKLPKRMFDLQLPADVYIDIEDSERICKENISKTPSWATNHLNSTNDVEHEGDVKLTLGTNGDPSCGKTSWKLDPRQQDGQSLNSLTGPMKSLRCDGESGLVSDNFIGVGTLHRDIQSHQVPALSNRSFLPGDVPTEKHRDEAACSNFVNAVKEEARWEWPSCTYEDGRSINGINSFYPGFPSEEYPMLSEPSQQKLKRGRKIPSPVHSEVQTWFGEKRTLGIGTHSNSSQLAEPGCSLVTTSQLPSPLEVIPFSQSTSLASVPSRRKPVITYNPIAVQALPCFSAAEVMKFRSRKLHKSVKNLVISQDKMQADGNTKSCPKNETETPFYQSGCHNDLCPDSVSSQLKTGDDTVAYQNSERNGPLRCSKSSVDMNLSHPIPSTTQMDDKHRDSSCLKVKKGRKRKNGASGSLHRKKILGFPVTRKLQLQQSNACLPSYYGIQNTVKNEVGDVETIAERVVASCIVDFQNQTLTKDEADAQTGEVVSEINMELLIPYYETLDNIAAENLVAISLDIIQPSTPSSCDSLHWFAEVISHKGENAEAPNSDDNNGLDLFESMMLELEEVKLDAYGLCPQEQEHHRNENDHRTPLLLTMSRRGHARKRRQRKDFQKDILPGLMSLSRHEVMEDLQTFNIMMRQSTGRKGSRWGQPSNLPIVVNDICSSPPLVNPSVPSEVEVDDKSITGWGRDRKSVV